VREAGVDRFGLSPFATDWMKVKRANHNAKVVFALVTLLFPQWMSEDGARLFKQSLPKHALPEYSLNHHIFFA